MPCCCVVFVPNVNKIFIDAATGHNKEKINIAIVEQNNNTAE